MMFLRATTLLAIVSSTAFAASDRHLLGEDDFVDYDSCVNTEDFGGIDQGCDWGDNICVDANDKDSLGHDVEGSHCVPCVNSFEDPMDPRVDDGCSEEAPRCVSYRYRDPAVNYAGDMCIPRREPTCKNDAVYGGVDSGCEDFDGIGDIIGVEGGEGPSLIELASIRRPSRGRRGRHRFGGPICVGRRGQEIGFHVGGSHCAACRNTQQSDAVADEGCDAEFPRCVMARRRRRRTRLICRDAFKRLRGGQLQHLFGCFIRRDFRNAPLGRAGQMCVRNHEVCVNDAAYGGIDSGCDAEHPMCVGLGGTALGANVPGAYCVPCMNTQQSIMHAGDDGCAGDERCIDFSFAGRGVIATGDPALGRSGDFCWPIDEDLPDFYDIYD